MSHEPKPQLLVFNLFHEEEPLFVHRKDGHAFYIAAQALEYSPAFARWVHTNYLQKRLESNLWLDRFTLMIRRVRRDFPETPIVLIQRLSHLPAYGPSPFSYLSGWDRNWQNARVSLEDLTFKLGNCHLIDMDRIIAGLSSRDNLCIDRLAPYLKLGVKWHDQILRKLSLKRKILLQRDLEHLRPEVWDIVAEKIFHLIQEGQISYTQEERVQDQWYNEPKRPDPPMNEIETWLKSGDLFDCAHAIGHLINKLPENHSDMLVAYRWQMPAGKYLLRMIKIYAKFQPDPRLLEWCIAHRKRACSDFCDLDESFINRYLKEISKVEQLSTRFRLSFPEKISSFLVHR